MVFKWRVVAKNLQTINKENIAGAKITTTIYKSQIRRPNNVQIKCQVKKQRLYQC